MVSFLDAACLEAGGLLYSKNCSRASSFVVQNTLYCFTHFDTSRNGARLASQYRSLPCWFITIKPHSVSILMCFEIAGRLISKFSATAFRFKDCPASISMMALRVGSAIAWNTSLLIV